MSGLLDRAIILHDQFLEMESIPRDERDKIIDEIDSEMNRGKLSITDKTFKFDSARKDGRFPLVLNISALFLLVILGLYSYQRFKSDEETLISRSQALNRTESRIIQQIKKESEEKLNEKDREIETIKLNMGRLQEEQSLLIMASRAEITRLEEALKEELDRQFSAEEEKLKEGGLTAEALKLKLDELKQRLDEDFLKSQKELIQKVEADRRLKEESLLVQIESYRDSLKTAEEERDHLVEQIKREQAGRERRLREEYEAELARQEQIIAGERDELQELRQIRDRSRNEEFILNQISASYKQIAEAVSRKDYLQAESGILSLETLIDREDLSGYPGLDSRKAADRLLLTALSTLIYLPANETEGGIKPAPPFLETGLDAREEELQELIARGRAHYEAGEKELSREAYLQAFALFPPLTEGYKQLKAMDISAERQRLTAEGYTLLSDEQRLLIEQAVREREIREKMVSDLDRIRSAVEEKESDASDQDELVEMLKMKVLLKEVLVSDAVRKEYPDLTRTLERYLQSYGVLKESSGRSLVLMDINEMMDALSTGESYSPAGGDELQTGLYLAFLEQLKEVLSAPE